MFSFQAVMCTRQSLVCEGEWRVAVSTATREILDDPNHRSEYIFIQRVCFSCSM